MLRLYYTRFNRIYIGYQKLSHSPQSAEADVRKAL